MKRLLMLLTASAVIAVAGFAYAADVDVAAPKSDKSEKIIEIKKSKMSMKDRIVKMSEGLKATETKLKAEQELREEALASAKKELERAKKFAEQGKDDDAEAAFTKAHHYLASMPGAKATGHGAMGMPFSSMSIDGANGIQKNVRIMYMNGEGGEDCEISSSDCCGEGGSLGALEGLKGLEGLKKLEVMKEMNTPDNGSGDVKVKRVIVKTDRDTH